MLGQLGEVHLIDCIFQREEGNKFTQRSEISSTHIGDTWHVQLVTVIFAGYI